MIGFPRQTKQTTLLCRSRIRLTIGPIRMKSSASIQPHGLHQITLTEMTAVNKKSSNMYTHKANLNLNSFRFRFRKKTTTKSVARTISNLRAAHAQAQRTAFSAWPRPLFGATNEGGLDETHARAERSERCKGNENVSRMETNIHTVEISNSSPSTYA